MSSPDFYRGHGPGGAAGSVAGSPSRKPRRLRSLRHDRPAARPRRCSDYDRSILFLGGGSTFAVCRIERCKTNVRGRSALRPIGVGPISRIARLKGVFRRIGGQGATVSMQCSNYAEMQDIADGYQLRQRQQSCPDFPVRSIRSSRSVISGRTGIPPRSCKSRPSGKADPSDPDAPSGKRQTPINRFPVPHARFDWPKKNKNSTGARVKKYPVDVSVERQGTVQDAGCVPSPDTVAGPV